MGLRHIVGHLSPQSKWVTLIAFVAALPMAQEEWFRGFLFLLIAVSFALMSPVRLALEQTDAEDIVSKMEPTIPLAGNIILAAFLYALFGSPGSWLAAPFGAVGTGLSVLFAAYCCGQVAEAFRSGQVDMWRLVIDMARPWARLLNVTVAEAMVACAVSALIYWSAPSDSTARLLMGTAGMLAIVALISEGRLLMRHVEGHHNSGPLPPDEGRWRLAMLTVMMVFPYLRTENDGMWALVALSAALQVVLSLRIGRYLGKSIPVKGWRKHQGEDG